MSIPNKKRAIRGCIDLGSSYFRLLVVRLDPAGNAEVLADEKEYVGWGASVTGTGVISERDVARAAAALESLLWKAREVDCEGAVVLGTNALRSAGNGHEARSALEQAAGLPITVVSQRIEAELGFLGASTIADPGDPVLLVDIGGTSTEISWGRGGVMEDYRGLPLGTHTADMMTGRNAHAPPVPFDRGLERLRESIEQHYALPNDVRRHTIIVTGGTAVSLAVVVRYMRERKPDFVEGTHVTAGMLDLAVRRIQGLFAAGLERRIGLESERLRLLLPGLALVVSLLRTMRVTEFLVTARDLRWGVVTAGEHDQLFDHGGRHR
jgi:exopolyphosphatase/guanosine-5'-triphosphate,3'-diphosphate pyrophosphatase